MKLAEVRGSTLPTSGAAADLDRLPDERVPTWAAVAVGGALIASLVLRFWTRSDLWLDEALTANVAHLPLHQLPQALRHDGAPPLYYVALHFWMGWFGTSDLALRALSGLIGVATLPLAWLAGNELGGRRIAWVTLLLVASSPFAVRYSTENRMYSLVLFLTFAGYLLLVSVLRRPRIANLIGLAVISGLLLYSHYWSLYLLIAVGLYLAWMAWRGTSAAFWALGALAAGAVTFVPWLAIFLYQLHHTGTPWAQPASFTAMLHAISGFAGGDTTFAHQGNTIPARALGLTFFALAGLALFGAAIDRRRIELDLRTRPRSRPFAFVVGATLLLAIVAGVMSGSTFQDRYTSVVFAPFVLLVALGTLVFGGRRVRYGVLALLTALGLAASAYNVKTQRTQAGQVAAAIRSGAAPGDVIGYCPDQLGPATSRLLPADLLQLTFPRDTTPRIVNWADYAEANNAGSAGAYARLLVAEAGRSHNVWLVWAPNYQSLDGKCEAIVAQLGLLRPSAHVVAYDSQRYYEFMDLYRFPPR